MPPLTGIRVLDLSRRLPGPYATMILADHGAEVIKVEVPATGDPVRLLKNDLPGLEQVLACVHRGKRSVTLNLRSEAGNAVFHTLLASSDVLVEGFRPGMMQRFDLHYDSLKDRYPELIYCSISGFGQSGPNMDRPGHDLNYMGHAGLLSTDRNGSNTALMPTTLLADTHAGLCAAFGIVLALQERSLTGAGRFVDVDMTRSLAPFLLPGLGGCGSTDTGTADTRPWFRGGLACYNVYEAADGQLITLAALEENFWRNFCIVIGRPDLTDNHLKAERQPMLHREIEQAIRQHTATYWIEVSKQHDVCIGPVRSSSEALADDCLRDAAWPNPLPSAGCTSSARELGADNQQILIDELDIDPEEVERAGGGSTCEKKR